MAAVVVALSLGFGSVPFSSPADAVGSASLVRVTTDCELRSRANARYVSAELGYAGSSYGLLRARATKVGPWEKFECVTTGTNQWAIRSRANGRYVTAELGYSGDLYGVLRARATTIGVRERF